MCKVNRNRRQYKILGEYFSIFIVQGRMGEDRDAAMAALNDAGIQQTHGIYLRHNSHKMA